MPIIPTIITNNYDGKESKDPSFAVVVLKRVMC